MATPKHKAITVIKNLAFISVPFRFGKSLPSGMTPAAGKIQGCSIHSFTVLEVASSVPPEEFRVIKRVGQFAP
jgi:hypothetical protein